MTHWQLLMFAPAYNEGANINIFLRHKGLILVGEAYAYATIKYSCMLTGCAYVHAENDFSRRSIAQGSDARATVTGWHP
ncbi:hypothetical protein P692DRAFT_201798406 [Suillus brevipes Sb2]|nr:hypothetical protein P692DRAFT_201798406 [Suillus brevipes Sb2]